MTMLGKRAMRRARLVAGTLTVSAIAGFIVLANYSSAPMADAGLSSSSCGTLSSSSSPLACYTTYTQGGWGAKPSGNNPAAQLAAAFPGLYPSGVRVGGNHTMTFTSATAVRNYKPSGKPAVLTSTVTNPATTSSGIFGGQVLALRLNVDFSTAGRTQTGFGTVKLCNTGTSLDNQAITSILQTMNTAPGGGGAPSGYTISQLNDLAANLNQSFDNGPESGWAASHLCP